MMRDAAERHRPQEREAFQKRLASVLAEDPAVRWAYLFGSAARNEAFRDLDVGVVLDPVRGKGAVRFGRLVAALEEVVPGIPVDVVDLSAASPALKAAAVSEGKLLLDREPEARKEWEVHVIRIWLDLKPWLEQGERLRLEALRRRVG